MAEITLTGGTLVPSSNATDSTTSPNAAANGHHQHHHHHHGHHSGHNGIEMARLASNNMNESLEKLVDGPEEDISRALSTLMRFGRYESFPPILEKLEEKNRSIPDIVLKQFDQGGHTLFHWAAKRVDDIRFLRTLVELATKYSLSKEVLNAASKENVGMRPLHWACTEGSIPHASLLLKNGADLESRDNSGCTPLLIAAQYGQVDVVAYLLKLGANIQAVDSSRDTALHWAAYKGHALKQKNEALCGTGFFEHIYEYKCTAIGDIEDEGYSKGLSQAETGLTDSLMGKLGVDSGDAFGDATESSSKKNDSKTNKTETVASGGKQ